MTITNTLANKFGLKEVEHNVTMNGVQYFTATDLTFGDDVELKVTANGDVYARMSIEGVDIDVEIDGASDFYSRRGTLGANQLTSMLEEIESFLVTA